MGAGIALESHSCQSVEDFKRMEFRGESYLSDLQVLVRGYGQFCVGREL